MRQSVCALHATTSRKQLARPGHGKLCQPNPNLSCRASAASSRSSPQKQPSWCQRLRGTMRPGRFMRTTPPSGHTMSATAGLRLCHSWHTGRLCSCMHGATCEVHVFSDWKAWYYLVQLHTTGVCWLCCENCATGSHWAWVIETATVVHDCALQAPGCELQVVVVRRRRYHVVHGGSGAAGQGLGPRDSLLPYWLSHSSRSTRVLNLAPTLRLPCNGLHNSMYTLPCLDHQWLRSQITCGGAKRATRRHTPRTPLRLAAGSAAPSRSASTASRYHQAVPTARLM